MKKSLWSLPCFTLVDKISTISIGLSQSCFKVNADNKIYFAKTVTDNIEVSIAMCASKSGLSPEVIYHDQDWLICSFIDSKNLAHSKLSTHEKINHAIKLMVQCHQLNSKPTELVEVDVCNTLIKNEHYSMSQQTALFQLAKLILVPLSKSKKDVCCHGDLNFSNVLINNKKRTWLVDYECAYTAPVEYDLAMLIAVNNLARDKVTTIIEQYEMQSSLQIDPKLLNHYLLFCYFINALWYFNTYHKNSNHEDNHALLKNTQKQWGALLASLKVNDSQLLSSLSVKLTDILPALNFKNQA
jgi:thiamine kinase-like enzyme